MRKNILQQIVFSVLLIISSYSNQINAQCNYYKSNNTVSVWDWRQAFYTDMYVYGKSNPYSPGNAGVPCPFIPPSGGSQQPNLSKFYVQYAKSNSLTSVDCQPDDGWELLAKEFGSATTPVNTPFFCLYNRYTGIVRAFFFSVQIPTAPQSGSMIRMQHITNGLPIPRESGIFSHLYPVTETIQNFVKGSVMTTPNIYVNQEALWLYADFQMAYDPCVCYYQTRVQFEYYTVQQMSITLNASINGYFDQVIGTTSSGIQSKENAFDGLNKLIKSGLKSYESWESTVNDIEKFAKKHEIELQHKILGGITNVKSLLTTLPYLGAAFSVMEFFQGMNNQGGSGGNSSPLQFQANLQFNGTGNLTQNNLFSVPVYWTPGSNQTAHTEKTIYDNPLGVLSFLKPFTVDYVDYGNTATTPHSSGGVVYAPIRQYKISNEIIKYALNPSALMDVVDIKAALVIKYKPIPSQMFDLWFNSYNQYGDFFPRPVGFAKTLNFTDKVESVGLETDQYLYNDKRDTVIISLRTPYMPLSCFKEASIFIHRDFDPNIDYRPAIHFGNDFYELQAKVIVKLKPKPKLNSNNELVPNSNKEVVFLLTYTINEESSVLNDGNQTHHWESTDGQFPTFNPSSSYQPTLPAPFAFSKLDQSIYNAPLVADLAVLRNLTIGPNVNISGVSLITAGNEIVVTGETIINQDVTLQISLPNVDCITDINSLNYKEDELNAFCNYSDYNNHTFSKTNLLKDDKISVNKEIDEIKLVAVNPFENNIKIFYNLNSDDNIRFDLINLNGEEYSLQSSTFKVAGLHSEEYTIDQNLPNGLYFLRLSCNAGVKYVKVIKISE
ncbi:MAG: T9SS type A sorting domain-containing protein [Bacteroidetes bacterium]|nr:T9SS type A sorting domain-containing protein [Bacteroidota bacterium]